MTGVQAITATLQGTKTILDMYLQDLSDADFFVRPAPTANHLAWQFGHLIASERDMIVEQLPDAKFPEFPANFAESYGTEEAKKNGPAGFLTKTDYVSLFDKTRTATIEALGRLSDADLDRPSRGNMASFAPRLGDIFLLAANHTLMHGGQFTVLRRVLGKPVFM
jgi:DinB superfamily